MQSHRMGTPTTVSRGSLGWAAALMLGVALAGHAPWTGAAAAQSEDERLACLAITLYWEAGGEQREGMAAVASVVLNRLAHPEFPSTICEVVREGGTERGCQFSYWCDGKSETPRDPDLWALARKIAAEALDGAIPDPTGGALFYHAAELGAAPWRIPRERTVQIGRHVYYR